MALKFAVKTLDEVPEALRGEYVEDKELGFKLALDGAPEDPAELRRAKQREAEGRKAAESEAARVKKELADRDAADAARQAERDEEVRKANEEAAKKAGNIDQLQKSWQEKYEKDLAAERAKHEPIIKSLETDVTREMIDRHATEMAAALAIPDSADVLYPHIRSRLRVEMREGVRKTVVVDKDGNTSAMTLADLKNEIAANKAFAPLLVGSRASGGGANGGNGGRGNDGKTLTRAEFEKLDPAAKSHFLVKTKGQVVDA